MNWWVFAAGFAAGVMVSVVAVVAFLYDLTEERDFDPFDDGGER